MSRPEIRVAVAYAERDLQTVLELEVPAGTTAAQAVARSGIRDRHPGIPAGAALGIYGRVVAPDTPLADGDRVELYRPLAVDPKEARRRRQQRQREAASGNRPR